MKIATTLAALFLAAGVLPAVASANRPGLPLVESDYITMRDGTRLAIDVWFPDAVPAKTRLPAIVQFTRYWRSSRRSDDADLSSAAKYFTAAGYVVAIADMRGTGASFGSRSTEFSDAEVQDYGEVFDWLAQQPWSNGRVATLGTSYLGNTAELAAIPARPSLRALVPRFSDFSEYRHAVRPGGVLNAVIAKAWVAATAALDRNYACGLLGDGDTCAGKDSWAIGVKPVRGDDLLLRRAVAEHAGNANLAAIVNRLTYSDDPFSASPKSGVTLDYVSPSRRWPAIDQARVPAFHWASWFDGGTAEGVLTRFMTYKTPINVIIGAWNHGGTSNANPYSGRQGADPPDLPLAEQYAEIRRFLDPLLKPELHAKPLTMGQIRYFTIGQNRWHITGVWPPKNARNERWYFSDGGKLEPSSPKGKSGSDRYRVDATATTGTHNRWHTQLGTFVRYLDRRKEDRKLLTYTSQPLKRDAEITGTPVAHVEMISTTPDGALFVYLEDVAPDDRITYLTEGDIRLLFHGTQAMPVAYKYVAPVHTFSRSEARPFPLDKPAVLEFSLNPISVVVRAGHRIRIAIAGADADTFERLPSDGPAPVYIVQRNSIESSHVTLPLAGAP